MLRSRLFIGASGAVASLTQHDSSGERSCFRRHKEMCALSSIARSIFDPVLAEQQQLSFTTFSSLHIPGRESCLHASHNCSITIPVVNAQPVSRWKDVNYVTPVRRARSAF
jgi:hypothetical protein